MHDVRFPGESAEYRQARDALLREEAELRRRIETVAARRRTLPLGGEVPTDYAFEEWDEGANEPRTVKLSELFAPGSESLFLYSLMFNPGPGGAPLAVACPMCTAMLDGIDGEVPHITRQTAFAVVAKAPIERVRDHGQRRGWRQMRLLSSAGTTYNADYQAEGPDGSQYPFANVFVRRDGAVHHFWGSELWLLPHEPGQDPRHIDFMWPLWSVLDRTPAGRGGQWRPSLEYDQAR
jgi:predicted dithiol-disulfide oxidoreductase (DUF899 family)